MTSRVPLLEHIWAQIFITLSSQFPSVYTDPFVTKCDLSPFQNTLSLSLIIQINLDHLLRTTNRYSLASLYTPIRYPCTFSEQSGYLILYEFKNLILGGRKKNKNLHLSHTSRLYTLSMILCCVTFTLKWINTSTLFNNDFCKKFTVSEQNTEFCIVLQQVPLQHVSQNIREITADF